MANFITVDTHEMDNLMEQLNKLTGEDREEIMNDMMDETANRYIAKAKKKTPVGDTGMLRRNWSMTNTSRAMTGTGYRLTITNPTEYAEYVEYGHRQTPGRYVPAIGKRLKKAWMAGQFYATRSAEELERYLPTILRAKFEQRIKEKLNV